MKTKFFVAIISCFCLAARADGPVIQTTPYTRGVLQASTAAQAQTALGFTGASNAVTLMVISNEATLAMAPITTPLSNNAVSVSNFVFQTADPVSASWMTNQSLLDWWNADAISTNDGASLNLWTGLKGGQFLGAATYRAQFVNGTPAVTFDGASQQMTNMLSLAGNTCTNTCSIFIDFRFPAPMNLTDAKAGQDIMFEANTNGLNGVYGLGQFVMQTSTGIASDGQQLFLNVIYYQPTAEMPASPLRHSFDSAFPSGADYHVFCATWSPTYLAEYVDGKQVFNSTIGGSSYGNPAIPLFFQGPMSIGNYFSTTSLNSWWRGGIKDILIFTNQLSAYSVDSISHYFMAKANALKTVVAFDGDSITLGGNAAFPFDIPTLLSHSFAGISWANVAQWGETSGGDYTNSLTWSKSSCFAGRKIAFLWPSLYNDVVAYGTNLAVGIGTNNLILESENLHSNGWQVGLITPVSNWSNDVSCVRGQYYNWATNCWSNTFDMIINLGTDPNVGVPNAWQNLTYFYVDGTHPTNAGNVAIAADVAPVLGQTLFGGSTNLFPGGALFQGGYPIAFANQLTAGSGHSPNVFLGGAGNQTVSGLDNFGLGFESDQTVSSGSDNVAIGSGVLAANTSGGDNLGIGYGVLSGDAAENGNVAVGYNSFNRLTGGGGFNIGLGAFSGYNVLSGDHNILIGSEGQNGDSHVLRIGDDIYGTASVVIGSGSAGANSLICTNGTNFFGNVIALKGVSSLAGFASSANTSSTVIYGASGITNTLPFNIQVLGATGSGWLSNGLTGFKCYVAATPDYFILQPKEAFIANGNFACLTNAPF